MKVLVVVARRSRTPVPGVTMECSIPDILQGAMSMLLVVLRARLMQAARRLSMKATVSQRETRGQNGLGVVETLQGMEIKVGGDSYKNPFISARLSRNESGTIKLSV